MDTMVEKHVGKCLACQYTTPCHTREPLQMTDLPRGPWQKVSVDFAGPLRNKDMALVFWDQYARYAVVEFTSSTFAGYVIPLFTRVFNTYGIPEEIKSDNGPPFNGSKFANFAQEQGFRHRKVTPGWAEANGDVERFMQTLKKSARTSKLEGKAIREGVQRTVENDSATPHPATKESPDMLMYVAVDLDQEGLDTSSAEETETGAWEDLRLQPDNLGAFREMTIGGPSNESDGPPTSLGATKTEGHQQQPDDTAVSGTRRSARARTSTWITIYRDFEPLEKRGET